MPEQRPEDDEELIVPSLGTRARVAWTVFAVVLALAIAVATVMHLLDSGSPGKRPLAVAPRSATQSADSDGTGSALPRQREPIGTISTAATIHDFPATPLARAVAMACAGIHNCRDRPAAATVPAAARRALGPVRTMTARVVPGRILAVAARLPADVYVFVTVTPKGINVAPSRLGIAPPIGIQTQHNGDDTLTAVVGGSVAALAVLGRPMIQRWLARLTV